MKRISQEQDKLTSSRTMAAIRAIRRFRLNSRPVESTAADLPQKMLYKPVFKKTTLEQDKKRKEKEREKKRGRWKSK